jgi:acetylglutamate kinase
VVGVNVTPILDALKAGKVPVVTPLGSDADGQVYNINADVAAGAMARQLQARKLVFLSDVPGILRDPKDKSTLISSLTLQDVEDLIKQGVIAGGMLPKVSGAVKAIKAGIRKTHIIDASLPHSLLLELFTEKGVGTEIVA